MGIRDIIFRGKRVDTGEWVYGLPYYRYDSFFGEYRLHIQRIKPKVDFEIDPETVGQFTGLKVNGQKVFEGDIIKFSDGSCFIAEQKYNLCSVKYRNLNNYPSLFNDKIDGIVIGNIHDNPELLEVK